MYMVPNAVCNRVWLRTIEWLIIGVEIKTFSYPVTKLHEPAITVCRKVLYNPDEYVRAIFDNFQMNCKDFGTLVEFWSHDFKKQDFQDGCPHIFSILTHDYWEPGTYKKLNNTPALSVYRRLMAPFYFKHDNPGRWFDDILSALNQMISGVEGLSSTLRNMTGIDMYEYHIDGEKGHPPGLARMDHSAFDGINYSIKKYIKLREIFDSLDLSVWQNLAKCVKNVTQVGA